MTSAAAGCVFYWLCPPPTGPCITTDRQCLTRSLVGKMQMSSFIDTCIPFHACIPRLPCSIYWMVLTCHDVVHPVGHASLGAATLPGGQANVAWASSGRLCACIMRGTYAALVPPFRCDSVANNAACTCLQTCCRAVDDGYRGVCMPPCPPMA